MEVLPYAGTAFLAPAWSLTLEWQFYLLAPFVVPLLMRSALSMLVVSGLLLIAHRVVVLNSFAHWQYQSFLPLALPYFVVGILSRAALEPRRRSNAGVELLLALGGVVVLFVGAKEALIWMLFLSSAMVESKRLRFQVPAVEKTVRLLAHNSTMQRLGRWSYSTYLIHIPIFSVVVGGYVRTIDSSPSQLTVVVLLILCLPLTVVASWVLFEHIEKPFNGFGRRIASRAQLSPESAGHALLERK